MTNVSSFSKLSLVQDVVKVLVTLETYFLYALDIPSMFRCGAQCRAYNHPVVPGIMLLEPFSRTMHPLLTLCLFCSLCKIIIYIKRIFFHPLSHFPGPKLAAATSLYKTYYEVVQGGEFLNHLGTLHEKYGDTVRVGPNELHFNAPRAYHDIYNFQSRYAKDPQFYRCFGVDHSTFGTVDWRQSKYRRDVLSSLFSRRSVLLLENLIQDHINVLITKLRTRNEPSNMFLAYRCATLDIIASYCFGKDLGALGSEDFAYPLLITIQASAALFWLIKICPPFFRLVFRLPAFAVECLPKRLQSHLAIRQQIKELIARSIWQYEQTDETEGIPTIYRRLLSRQRMSKTLISGQSLLDEALSLLQAGSDTVGNTCTIGTFHVLNNPTIHQKLTQELSAAWPHSDVPIPLSVLQHLPYLTAIIKESLRLSHGFVSPLPRVVDKANSCISGYQIPVGTIVGMSVTALHGSDSIFDDASSFSPERWLNPKSRRLGHFLVPFSRGPRMCLGINLAWVELYLILGNLFRRLQMEIYCTTVQDFEKFKDYFIPIHQGRHLKIILSENKPTEQDSVHTACL